MAWHVKYETIRPTTPEVIYYHNIGQVPDIFIIALNEPGPDIAILVGGGYSNRLLTLLQETYGSEYCNFPLTGYFTGVSGIIPFTSKGSKPIDSDGVDVAGILPTRNCDSEKITIGTNTPSTQLPLNFPLAYDESGSFDYEITIIWNDGELECNDIPQTFRTLTTSKNNGSYQIIDLKDIDLTIETPVKYDGCYNLIDSTRKVINLSGITINGVKYQDSFVSMFKSEDTYMCYLYNRTFVFYPNDELIVYQGKIEPAQYNYIEEDDL